MGGQREVRQPALQWVRGCGQKPGCPGVGSCPPVFSAHGRGSAYRFPAQSPHKRALNPMSTNGPPSGFPLWPELPWPLGPTREH